MKRMLSLCFIFFLLLPVSVYAQEKLTEEQAQVQIDSLKAVEASLQARISELESQIESLKSEIASLESQRDELQAKLDELKGEWKKCQCGRYKVKEGDWLSMIASMRNIYHEGSKWPVIYEANKDKIKNPNLIYPDWILLIPTLETYQVVTCDCLWLIASYLSVYSNAKRWPEIYEANKDKVKDPHWIYPKQEFVIPQ